MSERLPPSLEMSGSATSDGNSQAGDAELRRHLAMRARSIKRKATGGGAPKAKAKIPTEHSGAALGADERAIMEPRLGADLSAVRIHTNGESAAAATDLSARAFTVGNDIHFNRGEHAPGTREGDRLLAHELTHVVQGQGAVQRKGEASDNRSVSQPHDPAELEADGIADQIVGQVHDGRDPSATGVRGSTVGTTKPIHRKATQQPIVDVEPDEGEAEAAGGEGEDAGLEAKASAGEHGDEHADSAPEGDKKKEGAAPSPGDKGAPEDASKLSDEDRWKKIQEFLAGSATGQKALEMQKKYAVEVKWQKGGGSVWNGKSMVLDISRPTERVALAFVHEMNHAKFAKEGLGAHGKNQNVKTMGRAEYVKSMLDEEVEGTCLSIETKLELEGKGQKVSAEYPLEAEYRAAYEKAAGKKLSSDDKKVDDTKPAAKGDDKKPNDKKPDDKAAKPDDSAAKAVELDPAGKTAGRAAALKGFQDGNVQTSNTHEKYPDYYGKAWDKVNKDKKK